MRSAIHDFYRKISKPDPKNNKAECNTCGRILKYHCGTLIRHTRTQHEEVYLNYLELEIIANPEKANQIKCLQGFSRPPPSKRRKVENSFFQDGSDSSENAELNASEDGTAEKIEEIFVPNEASDRVDIKPNNHEHSVLEGETTNNKNQRKINEMMKDEKFIEVVYPQYKGKSKIELIENILDFKRQIHLLQEKSKRYEGTIKSFLKS